jgi:hypothetical protein
MKSKLQKKEIFIPLAAGADTGTDPRVPQSPVAECENVEFGASGVVSKRAPLAVLVGNTATDVPTAISSDKNPGLVGDSVVFIGTDAYIYDGAGSVTNAYASSDRRGLRIDIDRRPSIFHASSDGIGAAHRGLAICNSSLGNQVVSVASYEIVAASEDSGTTLFRQEYDGFSFDDAISGTNCAYLTREDDSDEFVHLWKYDAEALSSSNIGRLNWGFSSWGRAMKYDGPVSGSDYGLLYVSGGSNTVVYSVNFPANTLVSSSNIANPIAVSREPAYSVGTLAGGKHLLLQAVSNGASVYVVGSIDALHTNGDLSHLASSNVEIASSLTNASVVSVGQVMTGNSSGTALVAYQVANSKPVCVCVNFEYSSNALSLNSPVSFSRGVAPVSAGMSIGGVQYFVMLDYGGGVWKSSPSDLDALSSAGWLWLFASSGDWSAGNQFVPVGMVDEMPWYRSPGERTRPWEGASHLYLMAPVRSSSGSESSWSLTAGWGPAVVSRYSVGESARVSLASSGDYALVSGALPLSFGERDEPGPLPSIASPYILSLVQTNSASGNFANAGGVGTYYYSATFSSSDAGGRSGESSPSPSSGITITNARCTVNCVVTVPHTSMLASGYVPTRCTLYRTSESGNDFFRIASSPINASSDTIAILDYGGKAFTANTGLATLLSAVPLYTQTGEIAHDPPRPHRVSCVHAGRIVYADAYTGELFYSKSSQSGLFASFSDILTVPESDGGQPTALASYAEKLHIGKDRAWFVTHGQPLNDYGQGQGFAPPRLITAEHGVKYPTAAASTSLGVVFVSSSDGLIYLINQGEQVQLIGEAVRHYCRTYEYDNVYVAPQDNCIRVTSRTVGAPTLSFNYRVGQWSVFTGRYAQGTRAAFAAPVGASNTLADVLMDINGNVYVQDKSANTNSTESYNLSITTPWISLNDTAGYGRFYGWTLLGSKTGAALTLSLNTAYDYEPHWVDSQTYNADALTAFSSANQFSMNSSNTVIDNALKIGVDGSRHKTDAVRLKISDTNGLSRNNIEIVGARLEIGVKPGMTRLGSGRKV